MLLSFIFPDNLIWKDELEKFRRRLSQNFKKKQLRGMNYRFGRIRRNLKKQKFWINANTQNDSYYCSNNYSANSFFRR